MAPHPASFYHGLYTLWITSYSPGQSGVLLPTEGDVLSLLVDRLAYYVFLIVPNRMMPERLSWRVFAMAERHAQFRSTSQASGMRPTVNLPREAPKPVKDRSLLEPARSVGRLP